jgi:alkylation response protein AidB-like acyl-CoA dehydrogenase
MKDGLDPTLADWLETNANDLDDGTLDPAEVLPRLAKAGLTKTGVPVDQGGTGGSTGDAIAAIAAVSYRSMAVAFMLWGHRAYIEYLLHSPNAALRDAQLPDLLAGRVAGATGLSNAMKNLAGLEPLAVQAKVDDTRMTLQGGLPWAANLGKSGFHVALAADRTDGGPAMILALSSGDPGLERSADLGLMGMRSSDTAAVRLTDAQIDASRIISDDAPNWLPAVRPAFLSLQCGMSIGLAARALDEADGRKGADRSVYSADIANLRRALDDAHQTLVDGVQAGSYVSRPAPLFQLRIKLADIVAAAIAIELQTGGGKNYLTGPGRSFQRRWAEAAFVPIITPSIAQLRTALAAVRQAA